MEVENTESDIQDQTSEITELTENGSNPGDDVEQGPAVVADLESTPVAETEEPENEAMCETEVDVQPENGDVEQVSEIETKNGDSSIEMAVDAEVPTADVLSETEKEGVNGNVDMKDNSFCDGVVNGSTEVAEEQLGKEEGNFLNDITLGTEEAPNEAVEANGDVVVETGSKYTDKDAVRRVLIKSIDRKKTADDIEDYFFDNYSECGIEDVFTCYLPGKKKWFNGAAIVTFESEAQAQKFMSMDLKKEEDIGFRQKLYRICLADNKKKREERLKKFTENKTKQELNGTAAETVTTSRTIACIGFTGKVAGVAEIQTYLKDNHENVVSVNAEKEKTFVTFGDQRSADRFLGLSYVKFKGAYIHRKYGEEVKRGEKRKLENSDQKSGYLGAVKGAQFKLKGFRNAGTNYTVIKQGLEGMGVDKKELKFVSYNSGEAVVRLQTAKAREVVMRLNKAGFMVNGDRVVAQILTGSEEDSYLQEIGKAKWNHNRPKKEFKSKNDWSDY